MNKPPVHYSEGYNFEIICGRTDHTNKFTRDLRRVTCRSCRAIARLRKAKNLRAIREIRG